MYDHDFTLIVSGVDASAQDFEDRFFEAGCDDATLMLVNGLVAVSFTRAAPDFAQALGSALADVLKTGAHIERFEPDFLVSRSEIAERAHLTKAAVTHYVTGERASGFPSPVARITSASPLWDWVEVAEWFAKQKTLPQGELGRARISRALNQYLANHGDITVPMAASLIQNAVAA
jgi:hypothetical protein